MNSISNNIHPNHQPLSPLNHPNLPYFNSINQNTFIDSKSLNAYSNITSPSLNPNQSNIYSQSLPSTPNSAENHYNANNINPFLINNDTIHSNVPMNISMKNNQTVIRRTTSQPIVSLSNSKKSSKGFDSNYMERNIGETYLIVDRRGIIISAKNTNSFGHSSHSLENQQFIALLCDPYKQLFQILLSGYFMNGKYESVLFNPMIVELNTIIKNGHGSNPGSPLLLGAERIEWIRQNVEFNNQKESNQVAIDSPNYLAKITISSPNSEISNQTEAIKGENQLKDSIIVVFEKYDEISAVITTDGSGIIISTKSTELSFGLNNAECSRKPLSFLLPFFDFSTQVNGKTNDSKAVNVLGKKANGTLFWASLIRSTINVSGNFVLHQFQLTCFDDSNEAIILLNEEEHITRTSVFSLHFLFGLSPLELVGQPLSNWLTRKGSKSINELLQDDHSPASQERKKRKKAGNDEQETNETNEENNDVKSIKTQFKHSDGTQVPVLVQIFPVSSTLRNRHVVKSSTSSPAELPNQSKDDSNDNQSDPFNSSISSKSGNQYTHTYCLAIKRISSEESTKQTIDKYVFLEGLGRGAFSKVKRAVDSTTKAQVAIKIITKSKLSEEDLQRAHRETQIMMKLSHQHIVKLYKTIETPKKLYLVLEFVPGCDLMTYVIEKKGLSEEESKEIFVQLISALLYCHQSKVIHRDVKHKNILIDKTTRQIKLIDFGLSNWNEEGTMKTSYCGTPAFASPEMVLGHEYDGSLVDVWSAAVVLYSMLTAKFPFSNVGELISGTFEDPPNVSPECCDLIRTMLVVSPQNRSTLLQVSGHAWCKDYFQAQ
eukprot:TRINITY_DN609_c0_g2_i2.p1 TRINITY_DN609_c0_g2~~TRINITY_DN609_c0_g2_i2.p1  ORF type:complete len:829 (-),score=214.06 TRINITY_DN609_c0_g2_i2:11-2497(-)